MLPQKIFVGIDASGTKGFEKWVAGKQKWFTIAGVTCTDFQVAQDANNEISQKFGSKKSGGQKKGKDLHHNWREVIDILLKYPLRYYILFFDKTSFPPILTDHFREIQLQDSPKEFPYTLIGKKYSKHGWLIVRILENHGYKGPLEIRLDRDLQGNEWRQYVKEVKTHAENHVGPCDIALQGPDYPLVRIADLISNFMYLNLKDAIKEDGDYALVSKLGSLAVYMVFRAIPHQQDFEIKMIAGDSSFFRPW